MTPLKKRLRQFERQHPVLCTLGFAALIILPILGFVLGPIIFHSNTHHAYPFLYPSDQITGIQLVDVQDSTDLYYHPVDKIPAMRLDSGDIVAELDSQKIQQFLADFSAVPCRKWANDPCPVIHEGTILITYADGSLEWICAYGTFYQNRSTSKSSMTMFYFDDERFAQLLNAYGFH